MSPIDVSSSAQAGIWAGQALAPESPAFLIGEYVLLDGDLDESAFAAALRRATIEATALHVRFPSAESQVSVPPVDWALTVRDIADLDAAVAWMRAELRQPLDPLTGPLFGHALLRLGPGRRIWFHRWHHIVIDGFGIVLFAHRVAAIYNGLVQGGDAGPGFAPYDAVLAEDAAYRESPAAAIDRQFWADYFVGARSLAPPGGATGPAPDEPDRRRLSAPGVPRGTLVSRALAAAAIVMDRRTESGESVIGLPVAARLGSASRRVPCLAMNIVPLRIPVPPEATMGELVAESASQVRLTRPHQRYRYEQLRRDLGLVGGGRRLYGPVVNVMPFDYRFRLHGITATSHNLTAGPVEDLAFTVADRGDGLTVELAANPKAHLPYQVDALAAEFAQLLGTSAKEVVGARATSLSGPALPAPLPVLRQLERVAAAYPDQQAVVAPEATATYADLLAAVGEWADRLRTAGVRPGQLVAVSLPRGVEAIAAILGVLAAGAAYLPLDPHGPPGRAAALLDTARPSALITGDGVRPLPDSSVHEGDLAYVMFTSGSSGNPNPVAVPHRALAHFVAGAVQRYDIRPTDRVLQFAPLHFDASIEEIFPALCAGATVIVRTDQMMESMPDLVAECADLGVTVLDLPTAFWHELAFAELALPPSVRLVIIGGETALPERVRRWRRVVGDRVTLLNSYGPTEATVVATVADLTAPSVDAPIGRPLPGVRCAVARGELYLLGDGVAEGYLGRPLLSRTRFLRVAGERAYRTGDRVFVDHAGELHYLGRVDDQLKISGHRVVPAEIESILLRHPEVAEAAVVAQSANGEQQLVAFVVGDADPRELRRLAVDRLPDAVVPRRFQRVDRLPRTRNGKIDRAALRQLTVDGVVAEALPTPAEEAVARVWRDVLGVAALAPDDDFFDLGGTSLQTIQVANRLGVRASVVFTHPTLAGLAAALDGRELSPVETPARVPTVAVVPRQRVAPAGRVLLTGVTGFVGPHLLAELLRTGPERVACLIRARDAATATARLLGVLHRERLEVDWDRIDLVPGSLAELYEGPPVDAVYHCAATVSVVRDLASLRPTNVDATARLLQLGMPFHFVSTVGGGVESGYLRSKREAEELVRRAGEGGLPVAIYRLGRVVGAAREGAINPDDLAWRLLRAGLPRGVLPALDVAEAWTPVDWVARTLVGLARASASGEHTLVNAAPVRFSQVVDWVREYGYEVDLRPLAEWCAIVRADATDEDLATLAIFDRDPPVQAPAIDDAGPAFDPTLMARYLTRAVHDGWLPAPGGRHTRPAVPAHR